MQLKFKGSARKEILQARKFYKPFHRKKSVKLVCDGIVLKCVIWPPKLVFIICLLYVYIYFIYTYYRSTHYIYINITYVYTYLHTQISILNIIVFRDIYTSKADIILFMLCLSNFTTSFSCQCQQNCITLPVSKTNSDVLAGVENWDSKSSAKMPGWQIFFS